MADAWYISADAYLKVYPRVNPSTYINIILAKVAWWTDIYEMIHYSTNKFSTVLINRYEVSNSYYNNYRLGEAGLWSHKLCFLTGGVIYSRLSYD